MAREDLAAVVDRLESVRVLCIGDLMLDRFVRGVVERISPEAPIPVLRVADEQVMPGGAGNVVRNILSLGGACTFVSVVGDDEAGRAVAAMLAGEPRVTPRLLVDPTRPTTVKSRFVAGGQQLLRADREAARPLSGDLCRRLVEAAAAAAAECDAIVLSDYGKGVLADGLPALIAALREAAGDRTVIVDPKGADFGRYAGVDIVTPNRRELMEATGMPAGTDAEAAAAARALVERHGFGAVLVTRSEQGMTVVARATPDRPDHLPALAREVFDVSGAGDTVVATLALALGAGSSLHDAAALANTAAGIVVGKVGTATVHPEEVVRGLHADRLAGGEGKIVPAAAAADIVAAWRRRDARIGFTNGCFDLLHPGHVALLGQARAACDRLVVGINSDDSVRRLKGDGRPVQNEAARALVLASLTAVDLVVVFPEDTPLALIERLRPDVLVKGADYTLDTVVGADLVKGWGGSVLLADLLPGHSTSGTIRRMGG